MDAGALTPWLDVACDALAGFDRGVAWAEVSQLLRDQLHAPLAGTLQWHEGLPGQVAGFPEPTTYALADVAGRAPHLHPLAAYYGKHRVSQPLSVDDVPPLVGSAAQEYRAELVALGIDKHVWIPLPPGPGLVRICGACRPGEPFSEAEVTAARNAQRVLVALQLHSDALARWQRRQPRTVERQGVGCAEALHLTPREVNVLSLAAEGWTTAGIARRLGIAPRTADKHLENAYRKLGVRERVSAVRRAEAAGVLSGCAESSA